MGSSEVMHDPRQKVKLVSRKHKMGDSLPRAIAILFEVGFYQSKLQIAIHTDILDFSPYNQNLLKQC